MTSDHQKLFNAIGEVKERLTVIETLQEERHEQNRKDLNNLGNLTRAVEKHCHEIGKLKVHRATQWYFIGVIILTILAAGVKVFAGG
jgi:hypothetical protein